MDVQEICVLISQCRLLVEESVNRIDSRRSAVLKAMSLILNTPYSKVSLDNLRRYAHNFDRVQDDSLRQIRQILDLVILEDPETIRQAWPEAIHPVEVHREKAVFLVHGRDITTMEKVKHLFLGWGIQPIVLQDVDTASCKTIIEFLDLYREVNYAVIILTPDDEGRLRGSTGLEFRARENVVFEFGFFVGALGRNSVTVLKKSSDWKLFTDVAGVRYLSLDEMDWDMKLKSGLRAAGLLE